MYAQLIKFLKVKINDSESRLLFKKVCDMILDDKSFDECRDVHNQYFNKLTKLGFQDDIKFEKIRRRSHIMLWERGF